MVKIVDGTGKSFEAKVDSDNRLHVESLSYSSEHHANHSLGEAYTLDVSQTPTGAGDYFLYLKNTSEDDMVIEGFTIKVASAESIKWDINPTGTAVGTSATPTNLNAGSGKAATGTFVTGNDITGLTTGSIAYTTWHTSTESKQYNFEQDIILPKNRTLAAYAVTGAVKIDITVDFNYHSAD